MAIGFPNMQKQPNGIIIRAFIVCILLCVKYHISNFVICTTKYIKKYGVSQIDVKIDLKNCKFYNSFYV